jgi:hypothetical protein
LWSSYRDYVGIPGITDIDFALDIFSSDRNKAVNLFMDHTNENNTDECFDYSERAAVSDKEIMKYLNEMGITLLVN